jgi:hypothetical protein
LTVHPNGCIKLGGKDRALSPKVPYSAQNAAIWARWPYLDGFWGLSNWSLSGSAEDGLYVRANDVLERKKHIQSASGTDHAVSMELLSAVGRPPTRSRVLLTSPIYGLEA